MRVGAGQRLGQRLVERRRLVAVVRARRRVHHARRIRRIRARRACRLSLSQRRAEHVFRAHHVDVQAEADHLRVGKTGLHLAHGGEVEHDVRAPRRVSDGVVIAHVPVHELGGVGDVRRVTRAEVVQDAHAESKRQQQLAQRAPYEPGAARHQRQAAGRLARGLARAAHAGAGVRAADARRAARAGVPRDAPKLGAPEPVREERNRDERQHHQRRAAPRAMVRHHRRRAEPPPRMPTASPVSRRLAGRAPL